MNIENLTSFPTFQFDSRLPDGREVQTVAAKITYEIGSDQALKESPEQSPLAMMDEFYESDVAHSVMQESDLSPEKESVDLIIIGFSGPQSGTPARMWEAGVKVTREGIPLVERRILVTGERFWMKRWLPWPHWTLTAPEPASRVELRAEKTHGGEWIVEMDDPTSRRVPKKRRLTPEQRANHPNGAEKAPMAHDCVQENLTGVGFFPPWYLKAARINKFPAPQIVSLTERDLKFGRRYPPTGFGVMPKTHPARLANAGTWDDAFVKSRKSVPADMKAAYWNSGYMQLKDIQGGDVLELSHIVIPGVSSPIIKLVLPPMFLCMRLIDLDGRQTVMDGKVDTVILSAEKKRMSFVYRWNLPQKTIIKSCEMDYLDAEKRSLLESHCAAISRGVESEKDPIHA